MAYPWKQWNSAIKHYAKKGLFNEAIKLFKHMNLIQKPRPNNLTYIIILQACPSLSVLEQVHAQTLKSGHEFDAFLGCALADKYRRHNQFDECLKIFENVPAKDEFFWNTVIAEYARHGNVCKTMELLCRMQQEGLKPNGFCLGNVIGAFKGMDQAQQFHARAIKVGLDSDSFVGGHLLDSYAKSGNAELARRTFNQIEDPDMVAWNMIVFSIEDAEEAFGLLVRIRLLSLCPNEFLFSSLLKAFIKNEHLVLGQRTHACVIKMQYCDELCVQNSLISMYCRCDYIEDAFLVFDKMQSRDVISWTAMISGCVSSDHEFQALDLLNRALQTGFQCLSHFALASILSIFVTKEYLHHGRQIHCLAFKTGLDSDLSVANALLSMYARCGTLDSALAVFEENQNPDIVSWNALMSAHLCTGHALMAMSLFARMQRMGLAMNQFTFAGILEACAVLRALQQIRQVHAKIIKSGFQWDASTTAGLINGYTSCAQMDDACLLFATLPKQSVTSWNAMIAGFVENNHAEQALKTFCKMHELGTKANQTTYASVVRAIASIALLENAKQLHALLFKINKHTDVFVGSAMVDMYAKCGSIEDAKLLFNKMPVKNLVSWNAIITGYAMYGHAKEVFLLFEELQQIGLKPDEITFIGVLGACCHSGFVDEGCQYFDSMKKSYGLSPSIEHYSCMVDLLARAGYLEKAEHVIRTMPFEPDAFVWQSFLGACRIHGNLDMAIYAAQCLIKIQPGNSATYALLCNIFAEAGRWDEVEKLRKLMKEKHVKKQPGCSWIEVHKKVHSFVAHDSTHPRMKEIHAKLQDLHKQILNAGYIPDTRYALLNV